MADISSADLARVAGGNLELAIPKLRARRTAAYG
jgi:hypothetical protein